MESMTTQFDVTTYTGIAALVIAVIGLVKKMFKAWVDGKEPHLGLALSFAFGIIAKIAVPGAFDKVNWLNHLVSLLVVAAGAKIGHDYFVNQIMAGKPSPDEKK